MSVTNILALLVAITLALCSNVSAQPNPNVTLTPLATNSVTVTNSNTRNFFYSYTTSSLADPTTDFTVGMIVAVGRDVQTYCSLAQSPQPSFQNNQWALFGTGSVLVNSANYSGNVAAGLPTSGGTIYCRVVVPGYSPRPSFTLTFSTTLRKFISFANAPYNATITLPALPANSIQYVTLTFPTRKGNYVRGYFSFAAAYATGQPLASLTPNSVAAPQPAILWSHYNWQGAVNSLPAFDPTLPATMATTSTPVRILQTLAGSSVVTFDRDQSYTFPGQSTSWYVFAIYVPYAVPAGSVFALSNVFTIASAAAATDLGSGDFPTTDITVASGLPATNIALGEIKAYSLSLPASAGASVTMSLNVVSGNCDLYVVRKSVFEGASLDAQGVVIPGAGYSQGKNLASNGQWVVGLDPVGNTVPSFDFTANGDGSDSVTFTYSSPNGTAYYVIIAVGARVDSSSGVASFSINTASASPVVETISNTDNAITARVPGGSVQYYQYTYNGQITNATDISMILVASSGSPQVFISLRPAPAATNNNGTFIGSGSLLLKSAASSGNPKTIIATSGTVIYVAVIVGLADTVYSLSFSSTERVFWTTLAGQSASLPAAQPNTIQYVQWRFPFQFGDAREYMSFAFTYTTNTDQANLGYTNNSQAAAGPAIAWNHVNFYQTNTPPADPLFSAALATASVTNAYQSGAFITYDRDQSYRYSAVTVQHYVWAIYIPFSVPAGGVATLSDLDVAATLDGSTDSGGDDLNSTRVTFTDQRNTITYNNVYAAGGVDVYHIGFPISSYTGGWFAASVSSVSGNVDIFAMPTQTFLGAAYFNETTGQANDFGNIGYNQGANIGTNGYYNGAKIAGFTYSSIRDSSANSTDTVQFPWSATISSWWTVIVFAQQTSSYTLTLALNSTRTAVVNTLPDAGLTFGSSSLTSMAAGTSQYFQYTVSQAVTPLTDISLVVLSSTGARAVTTYVSTANKYPGGGSNQYALSGTGSVVLKSANISTNFAVYNQFYYPGAVFYVGVYAPFTPGANSNFSIYVSYTERIQLTPGLVNQTLTVRTALPAASVQYFSWRFPLQTTSYTRGYYSFAAGFTTNTPLSSISSPIASPQPIMFWEHANFAGSNTATNDPGIPATVSYNTAVTGYQGGAFVAFNRDQSYPDASLTTSNYNFGVFLPYAVPANTAVFALTNVDGQMTGSDRGGEDWVLAALPLNSPQSGSVAAAGLMGYKFMLPAASASQSVTVTLTSSSGNADLFVVEASKFYGAPVFDPNTGLPDDSTGIGYNQWSNNVANAYWVDSGADRTTAYDYFSGLDGAADTVTFTYGGVNSTTPTWYVVIVYGQRAASYSLQVASNAITFTDIGSSGTYTQTVAASTMTYLRYTLTSTVGPLTDLSVMVIAASGSPRTFVQAVQNGPITSSPYNINGTGSLFLHSATALSGNPVSIVPATTGSSTIYIGVQSGSTAATFTLIVSATERISLIGIANHTVTMPATPANTIQIIRWAYNMTEQPYAREYMSYGVSYASNQMASALSTSGPMNQPAIIFSHNEFVADNNNLLPTPDPTFTYNQTMLSRSSTLTGAFAVLDRVQSYPYPNSRVSFFTFMVYIPYAVPAGAVFAISSLTPASVISAASDDGGNSLLKTTLRLSNGAATTSGSLALGSVTGFNIGLPPATSPTSVTVTMTTTSGQAYIYGVESAEFAGAVGVNPYTGEESIAAGSGWAVDGYWASNAYWVGTGSYLITPFPYLRTDEGNTNSVTFTYTSTTNAWYTFIAFVPRGTATYTLNVAGPNTPLIPQPAVSSSSSTGTTSQSSTSTASNNNPAVTSASTGTTVRPSSSSSAAGNQAQTSTSSAPVVVGGDGSSSSSLSGGAIAGIVIGSVVGAAILIALICFLLMGAGRGKKQHNGDEDVARNTGGYSQSNESEASQVQPEVEMEDVHNNEEETV